MIIIFYYKYIIKLNKFNKLNKLIKLNKLNKLNKLIKLNKMTKLYYKPSHVAIYYSKKSDDMVEFDTHVETKHNQFIFVVGDKQTGLIIHIGVINTVYEKEIVNYASHIIIDHTKYYVFSTYILCECGLCSNIKYF